MTGTSTTLAMVKTAGDYKETGDISLERLQAQLYAFKTEPMNYDPAKFSKHAAGPALSIPVYMSACLLICQLFIMLSLFVAPGGCGTAYRVPLRSR